MLGARTSRPHSVRSTLRLFVPAGRNIYSSKHHQRLRLLRERQASLSKEPTLQRANGAINIWLLRSQSTNAHSSHVYCLLLPMPVTNHIRQHAIRAGHACAQLAIPNHAGIDVSAPAVISHQQTTLQWRLAGIVRLQQSVELRVPILWIVKPAFLDPVSKIFLSHLIGKVKQRMLWL